MNSRDLSHFAPAELTGARWWLPRLLANHRWAIDSTLAILYSVPAMVASSMLQYPGWEWTLAALIAAGGALLWRRVQPVWIVAIGAILTVAPAPSYLILPLSLAVYTVASLRPALWGIIGYGISVVIPIAIATAKPFIGLTRDASPISPNPITLGSTVIEPVLLIALIVGLIVHSRAERREDLTVLLNQRIDNARAMERNRIAAEMHDVVGHSLTVMIALANGASTSWQKHPQESALALRQLSELGQSALADMQRTLRMLREADADLDEGLNRSGIDLPPLEDLIDVFRRAGLPLTLTRIGTTIANDDTLLALAVYRIVQEALTNVLRYATDPVAVTVTIHATADHVQISIVDDGSGRPIASQGTGRGLVGIAERAASFGGSSHAGPRAEGGWETTATLALAGVTGQVHG